MKTKKREEEEKEETLINSCTHIKILSIKNDKTLSSRSLKGNDRQARKS